MSNSDVLVVFSPDRLRDTPPPAGAFAVVVRYARRNEEVADAAAILTALERPFQITWVSQGGAVEDPAVRRAAETDMARALARSLSRGTAGGAVIYREDVERVAVSQAEVETVCEV